MADKMYVAGLIKAKDIAREMADKHQKEAEEIFDRLKKEFYPIPYDKHTEDQKETRRVLQNAHLYECSMTQVLFDLIQKLWNEILKDEEKESEAV